MATVTQATTAIWTTTAGNKTTAAFTPALGDLLVIIAPATGVATSAISDTNADGQGSYTKIESSFTGWSTAGDLSVWVRNSLIQSATSMTVTVTQTGSTGGGLEVYRVSGMTRTGRNAVRSSGGQSTGTAGTTPAPVLSLTPLTGNPIITAVCNGTSPAGVTQPASYTEPTNLGYSTPTAGLNTAFINSGITNATVTWGSTSATAFGSVTIELDTSPVQDVAQKRATRARQPLPPGGLIYQGLGPVGGDSSYAMGRISWNLGSLPYGPITTGPRPSWSNPVGIRAVYVRTGSAQATQVTPAVIVPQPAPFFPARRPAQAKLPWQPFLKGRVSGNSGAPVKNPTRGPVFVQASRPFRAQPVNTIGGGVASSLARSTGAISGPVTNRAPQGCNGAPVQNPGPPTFTQLRRPVQFRLPPFYPKGKIAFNQGAPVINPTRGPPFRQATSPVQARQPLPQAGRVYGILHSGASVKDPTTGPVFKQAVEPVKASAPPTFSKGRVYSNPGAPVKDPTSGPPFRQATSPVKARQPLPPRGWSAGNKGAPVFISIIGPPFRQATSPARIRPSLPPRGTVASNKGSVPKNPTTGPVFRQANAPVQARIPQVSPRGRISSSAVTRATAQPVPPPFFPVRWPVRSQIPQNAPRGRIYQNPGAPVQNPNVVAATGALPGAVRATLPVNPRGRTTTGSITKLVVAPQSPPFFPFRKPAQAKLPLQPFLKGRTETTARTPIKNPTTGPVFEQAITPIQARIPQTFSKGRVSSNPGAPVKNPTRGPVFRQATSPARIRPSLPPRGWNAGNKGAPVFLVVTGPPFRQATSPARIRPSLPTKGYNAGNKGAPVKNPVLGAAFPPAHGPVQARQPLPVRGRISSNPGAPPVSTHVGPPFYPVTRVKPKLLPISGAVYENVVAPPPASSISYNTGATAAAITATSVNITIPSGVLVNDVMIMSLTVFTETATPPTVSFSGAGGNWTLMSMTTGVNPELAAGGVVFSYGYAYYRVATAGDPGAILTISESGSGAGTTWLSVAIAAYTGANTTSPVDVAGGANNGNVGNSLTLPTETTGNAGDWAIYLGSGGPGGGATFSGPAGSASRQNINSAAGVGALINDSNGGVGNAGTSIGGGTVSSSAVGNEWLSGFTVGLIPASVTVAPVASQFAIGRIIASQGAPVKAVAPITSGPVFRSRTWALQATQPLPFRGRVASNKGSAPKNPTQGPVFRQAVHPAQSRIPQNGPRGRIASNKGAPVKNPTFPPPFFPTNRALRAQPGNIPGTVYQNLTPAAVTGPVANPITFNTGVTASANTASSVNVAIPAGVLTGDMMLLSLTVFTQSSTAPTIAFTGGSWTLIGVNPGTNPEVANSGTIYNYGYAYYRVATVADPGSTLTISESGSFAGTTWFAVALASYTGAVGVDVAAGASNVSSGPGGSVTCPSLVTTLPGDLPVFLGGGGSGVSSTFGSPGTSRESVVSSAGIAAAISDSTQVASGSTVGGGQFTTNTGGISELTAFTVALISPLSPPASQPTRAPQFATGRIMASYGGPVQNPVHVGPRFRQATAPIRIRPTLPPRGRIGFNPGTPVPLPLLPSITAQPMGIRVVVIPTGRIRSSRGAPVKPLTRGPVFRQAVRPARAPIPQNAPRGRTSSNPGGPVKNPLISQFLITPGLPATLWATGQVKVSWAPQLPLTLWSIGMPFVKWQAHIPFVAWNPGHLR